jgi:hypothetical protein
MSLREVLFEDLVSAAKDSGVVTLDLMDVVLKRGQPRVSEEVATGLQGLETIARGVGRHTAFVTKGPRSEAAEFIRAIAGSARALDFSSEYEGEVQTGGENYSLRQYPNIKLPGLNVFGVYANGGVFAFFDKKGVYTELDLMDPKSFEPARRLTDIASKSKILGGAVREHKTPYPDGYLVITLPAAPGVYNRMYMDYLESGLRGMVRAVDTEGRLRVSRKDEFRLYVEPARNKKGEDLNKYTGLRLGASQADVLGGLGFNVDGKIHIADNIQSESEMNMLKGANLGVEVTNNADNVLRVVKGLPPILYVRDGVEALKEVALALSLTRPEVAEQVHRHLRKMGYGGREAGSVSWSLARPYVIEAIGTTDRIQ